MKFNKITLGVAIAGLMTAGAAFAHGPAVTPDIELWMSGASAEDGMIGTLFNELCVSGTLDTYLSQETKPGSSHRAFFCTLDNAKVPGLALSNPKVLLHKRSAGGSGFGVAPVADGTPIAHMSIANNNCSVVSANTYHCTTTNPGDIVNQVSDAGISDVEPALFVSPNVPSGFAAVTPAQLNKLNITSQVGLVFGVPVTKNLRDALQQVQGITPVGSEAEDKMPSLSREQIASLMNGGIRKWDALKVNGVSLTSAPGVTGPADTKVHICRRVEGSGTQAQFNANFLRVPCTDGAAPPLTSSNPVLGPVVTLNSGSGDLDTCLHNENGANNWAIGLQSTENNTFDFTTNTYPRNYRFIKVDGVAPTIKNAANNQYFDWAENSIQWRKATFGGPAGDKLVILTKIATDAGKPNIVANVNNQFKYSWGDAGYLALNTNGWTGNTPFNPANPVATATHVLGGAVSNCRVPQVNKSSELF